MGIFGKRNILFSFFGNGRTEGRKTFVGERRQWRLPTSTWSALGIYELRCGLAIGDHSSTDKKYVFLFNTSGNPKVKQKHNWRQKKKSLCSGFVFFRHFRVTGDGAVDGKRAKGQRGSSQWVSTLLRWAAPLVERCGFGGGAGDSPAGRRLAQWLPNAPNAPLTCPPRELRSVAGVGPPGSRVGGGGVAGQLLSSGTVCGAIGGGAGDRSRRRSGGGGVDGGHCGGAPAVVSRGNGCQPRYPFDFPLTLKVSPPMTFPVSRKNLSDWIWFPRKMPSVPSVSVTMPLETLFAFSLVDITFTPRVWISGSWSTNLVLSANTMRTNLLFNVYLVPFIHCSPVSTFSVVRLNISATLEPAPLSKPASGLTLAFNIPISAPCSPYTQTRNLFTWLTTQTPAFWG